MMSVDQRERITRVLEGMSDAQVAEIAHAFTVAVNYSADAVGLFSLALRTRLARTPDASQASMEDAAMNTAAWASMEADSGGAVPRSEWHAMDFDSGMFLGEPPNPTAAIARIREVVDDLREWRREQPQHETRLTIDILVLLSAIGELRSG